MKKFYMLPLEDGPEYLLAYCETPDEERAAIQAGYERITRRDAIGLCVDESKRRRAGFAPTAAASIPPFMFRDRSTQETPENNAFFNRNHIWELLGIDPALIGEGR